MKHNNLLLLLFVKSMSVKIVPFFFPSLNFVNPLFLMFMFENLKHHEKLVNYTLCNKKGTRM